MKNSLLDLLEYQREVKQKNPSIKDEQLVDDYMTEKGYINIPTWCHDDIRSKANDLSVVLTEDDIVLISNSLEESFDAGIGVDWDQIEWAINNHLDDN